MALQTRDPSAEVPLSINCWPSTSGGDSYVNIEYECTLTSDLLDVTIAIPLPPLSSGPRVNQVRTFKRSSSTSLMWAKCHADTVEGGAVFHTANFYQSSKMAGFVSVTPQARLQRK